MKMQYFDEENFHLRPNGESVEFSEEFYSLAKDMCANYGTYNDLIVIKNKSGNYALSFAINRATDRVSAEIGTNLYRITIDMPYSKVELRDRKMNFIL